jgi:LAO/AO transport system kinase
VGHRAQTPSSLTDAGEFDARRRAQQVERTWSMVRDTVLDRVLAA